MSSGSQEKHAEVPGELTRELRQFNELGAFFVRAAATRIGLAVTDMQIMDILDLVGPATAGQLAEFTGLTTGAITRILDRLEEAELVRRERDPNDGRKVIVRLARGQGEMHKVRSILDSIGKVWDEAVLHYDDEQIAFLLEFLKHSNALSRQELVRLQGAPSDEEGIHSAPLADQKSGRLAVSCGISRLSLRADDRMAELYQARFEGPLPNVKTKEGAVIIRYPRRLLGLGEKKGTAEIALNATIPWRVTIQGGAGEVVAELSSLYLAALEIMGGFSVIRLDLPAPSGVVPIRIGGGAAEITVRHPVGVAIRVKFKGWISRLVFDNQTFSDVGNNAQMQSRGFDPALPCYDIEVMSYATIVTITPV